jgi:NNP family nitrate/nitrite transporter-like MFS transporter
MWDQLLSKGIWKGPIWNKRKNQEIYQEWLTITAIKNEAGETKNYAGMFKEMHEIEKEYVNKDKL